MRADLFACLICVVLATTTGCVEAVNVAAPVAVGQGSPPVLDAITQRTILVGGFPRVIPEFHFHDADGDVRFIARELVDTNGPYEGTQGAPINLPPDLQKRGAVFAGGWACGANSYHATLRAYLIDQSGNRSNAMTYTIHCNGG